MILRKVALAAVTIAASSPAISNASPERISAKACASAFASSIAAPGAAAAAYKLAFRGTTGGSALSDFYPSDFTFTLEARDPKTGLPIARALCSTDYRGTVTTISAVPLNADAGKLASQN
jgi:hypothetical protein